MILRDLEESPSGKLCKLCTLLIEREDVEDFLDFSIMKNIFINLVQKGSINHDLGTCGIIGLLPLARFFDDRNMTSDDIHTICNFTLSLIKKKSYTSICHAVTLFQMIGERNPFLLDNDILWDVIIRLLSQTSDRANCLIVPPIITFTVLICKNDRGRCEMASRNVTKLLATAFRCYTIFYDDSSDGVSRMANAIIEMSKSKVLKKHLKEFGVFETFLSSLTRNIFDSDDDTLCIGRALEILKEHQNLCNITNALKRFDRVLQKIASEDTINPNQITNILLSCHTALLLGKNETVEEADALKLIANVQEILIKLTIINGEDFQNEIRYLSLLVLNNLISRLEITLNYRFFLKYCIRMTKEDFPLRRACAFACMGKIIQMEQDINMICRTDLLQCIDWASKMTLQNISKNDLSQDLQQALTTSTIVTRKLFPRLLMLIETKESAVTLFRVLSSVHEHLRCELLMCAYGKDKNFAALLRILGAIIEQETRPFLEEYVVDQILFIISKDQEACFRCNDIAIIFNYLKMCPKVIVLIERISSTQEGTTELFCVPGCVNSMCNILLGNSAFNALVVSRILSRCVIFGQISLIKEMSKKHICLHFSKRCQMMETDQIENL